MTIEKKYDLEERTLKFAKSCIDLCRQLSREVVNNELGGQFVRSASSIGANYREANETGTKKDFYHRIRISLREAKETKYWLELLRHANQKHLEQINGLLDEVGQLIKIFASIANADKS